MLCVNDLSHIYISVYISLSLCHIRPVSVLYRPCGKRHIRADKGRSYDNYNSAYLKKSVANKRNDQSMTLSLNDPTRILRGVHRREVKHCNVWLSIVVVGKL